MTVVKSGETGSEEWDCASCGRRLLLRWPPRFERIVLLPGDDSVVHVGARHDRPVGDVPERELRWLNANGIRWP
ncbi:hypothetical protein M1L60_27315 [Actinoplanes sp. TRM 88003]|uniref:Uncharacterized protein n=1 Tax=Paractinoplanes aksuensis TaxID=2939490 RepID=A0ABT1DWI4_9ACTN|nr:hypothetical protein [Actinoplanes aksuensis]MCO8274315.1 hypothetical protein [Actinoplanes aksuensis]